MNSTKVIGIDIGGSHITVALVDLQTRSLVQGSCTRKPVKSKGDAAYIIKEWTESIAHCKARCPGVSHKVGMAMPGPFDYVRGISLMKGLDKFDALYNLNIKRLLAKELNIDEQDIAMMNDASCFLKGEIFSGTAGACERVIGLTLGTGLGSAFYIDGDVQDGDMYCYPFKNATAEDYLSTRWFIKRYKQLTGITANNVKEICDRRSSDPSVTRLFKEFGANLGAVLADYVRKYEIELVVIGGNLIKPWELFISETENVLKHRGSPAQLVRSDLGETAALLGAGSLFDKAMRLGF